MGKFRLKTGFTLAEALIAMAIIGVVMALLLRALNRAQPDKEKMMYSKSYHTLETVVYETINDYTKYDQDIYADEHADFSQDPLEINGEQAYVEIKGTKYNVTKDNALCYYAAEKDQFACYINVALPLKCLFLGSQGCYFVFIKLLRRFHYVCQYCIRKLPLISFCRLSKNSAAWAPSIWVWWNWNETVRVRFHRCRLYLPHIMNGLLNIPLYIPTAPSMSYWTRAEVPMTILSVMSWFRQLSATCCVRRR